ncbi:MAG: virulence RhuM family protein [Prevotellaceae bacterium]|jgi:hypothetical protein|nr:virulence RhuM family protein [Prevotellaceae bacterium]
MNKSEGKIILYSTADGKVSVDVYFEDETFWLSQKLIAELFQVERSVITKHLNNIFEEEELDRMSTCAKFAQVQMEGNRKVTRMVEFYNLDAIIAVGYRVNSRQATRFRQWATSTLKEHGRLLATQFLSAKSKSHGAESDEVTFDYRAIQPTILCLA